MFNKINALFHPQRYQGIGKTKRYFEGWYYKLITADEKRAIAIIPGVAMDEMGKRHGFIQVLDGNKLTSEYYNFPFENFNYENHRFKVSLGPNTFSGNEISLDHSKISGTLNFENTVSWPDHVLGPGIMGPFTFVPFMECYHGILSMDHTINGSLVIKGESINFTKGKGYIEKDWGHTFPSSYFWMQSNHFSKPGISFKASVARIPWLGKSFTGFIAGLWLDQKLYKFTTYNSTRLVKSSANEYKVELEFKNKRFTLSVLAERHNETDLAAPIAGLMEGRIAESMSSILHLKLTRTMDGALIFEDAGRIAALEVAGNIKEIMI